MLKEKLEMDFYIDTTIKKLHEMGAIAVRTYYHLPGWTR